MAENKMAEVAALFGKKLGHTFRVVSHVRKIDACVRFTNDGLEYYDYMCKKCYPTDAFLREILTGQAVIVDD
jgi:hypothetical protein